MDILINAAGITNTTFLPKTDPGEITQTLRTNLEGAIHTSRALMRASIRGRLRSKKNQNQPGLSEHPSSKCIINISSLLAIKAGTGTVPYAASKAGLLGLTRSVAAEAADTLKDVVIRSNAILPGYIETPMVAGVCMSFSSKGGMELFTGN